MAKVIPLREMAVGQHGTIAKISARGEMNRRMRDMGLVKGTPITIHGRAPLYDPVNIRLRDYNLTLRNNEADFIQVELSEE